MAEHHSFTDKAKLVRCWMLNPEGKGLYRFVELEIFRLWEYLMSNKHGMTVQNPTICLWVSDDHFQRNHELFESAGQATAVDRVTIERFDPNFKFANLIHRYCDTEDTDILLERLKDHLRQSSASEGNWDTAVTRGWAIEPSVGELVEPIALGIA